MTPVNERRFAMKQAIQCWAVVTILLVSGKAGADETGKPVRKAKVSFDDFKKLVVEVEPHRAERLIDLDTFLKMSQEPGVIVLDARSTFRYERIHVKGAKHLSFTDFTQSDLAKVIPSPDTKILIYCNNNFDGNQVDFMSKMAAPLPRPGSPAAEVAAEAKPVMLALNIPTYITLYGYGYRNVYELNELVKVTDPRIKFEGSTVEPKPVPSATSSAK
jgi:hypothetical protein